MFSSSRSNGKNKSFDEVNDHHHVGGVHIGGRDYGVVNDRDNQDKTTTSSKDKPYVSSSSLNSNKTAGFHQSQKEEESKKQKDHDDNVPKNVKSHHNIGGVHVGGNNYGTITMSGEKNKRKPSDFSSKKPDKYGNIGGYHKRGDNFDDVHYGRF